MVLNILEGQIFNFIEYVGAEVTQKVGGRF